MFPVRTPEDFFPHIREFLYNVRALCERLLLCTPQIAGVVTRQIGGDPVHGALHVAVGLIRQGDAETLHLFGHLIPQDGERLFRMARDKDASSLREKVPHQICNRVRLPRAGRSLYDHGIVPLNLLRDGELFTVRGHGKQNPGILPTKLREPLFRLLHGAVLGRTLLMQSRNRPKRLRDIARRIHMGKHAVGELCQSVRASTHEKDGVVLQSHRCRCLWRQRLTALQKHPFGGKELHRVPKERLSRRAVKGMDALLRKRSLHRRNSRMDNAWRRAQNRCIQLRLRRGIENRDLISLRIEDHAYTL